MKLYIYTKHTFSDSSEDINFFADLVMRAGVEVKINVEYVPLIREHTQYVVLPENQYDYISEQDITPDAIMLSIGGDGTFLEAVRRLHGLPMPILGINMGRLGFLANLLPEELEKVLPDLIQGNYTIEKRKLLKISGVSCEDIVFPYAFNEFTLHRHEASMIDVEVYADNDLLAVYRGDGVIVATPSGSTAYSLSAGGPILTPDCANLVITGLAPHNLSIRPVVMPDDTVFTMRVATRGKRAIAFLDNLSCPISDGDTFTIKKAQFSVFLIRLQNISFYDTLRNKMMWGLDKRDSTR